MSRRAIVAAGAMLLLAAAPARAAPASRSPRAKKPAPAKQAPRPKKPAPAKEAPRPKKPAPAKKTAPGKEPASPHARRPSRAARRAPPTLDAILSALRRTRTLTARFTQVKLSPAFVAPQRARGRVAVAPPRRLRWEYVAPYRALLVVNGDRASLAYPDLGRKRAFDLRRDPALGAVARAMLFVFGGDANAVRRAFRVTVLPRPSPEAPVTLRLTPTGKAAAGVVSRAEATIDLARGLLLSLTLGEPGGGETRIRFHDLRPNARLDAALFSP